MAGNDPGFVTRQYEDAANLNARATLLERSSENPRPRQRWAFDDLDLPTGAGILEIGCGPGQLWAENADRLSPGWTVTLTSEGMLREAGSRLGNDGRLAFRAVDVRHLPFENGAVVANPLLYHLADRGPVLSEISRVPKTGGVLHAATNGQGAREEMGRMQRVLDPSLPVLRHPDALVVTEAGPPVEYRLSGSAADKVRKQAGPDELHRREGRLRELLEKELAARAKIRITKDSGVSVARGPR